MNRIVESEYDSDIDGNRGISAVFYELTSDDTPEIISQLIEFIQSSGELPDNPFTAQLIDPISEDDVSFELDPSDYLSKTDMLHILKEYNHDTSTSPQL